jgi:RNA polymerase sigma factor (sigma-70 family)
MGTMRRDQDHAELLAQFEGLIITTARMHAKQVRWDEEDMAQELRVKVWKALPRYDSSRSTISLRSYVFGVITNRVKDFKRDTSREVRRRSDNGISFMHTEDWTAGSSSDMDNSATSVFEALFHCASHDEVYGAIDEGKFLLPATLTNIEARVLVLLMMQWSKPETALRLGLSTCQVQTIVGRLRRKLADWDPGQRRDESRTFELELALVA